VAVLVSFLCACGVDGGCGGMEALPWMALAGGRQRKVVLGERLQICRFAAVARIYPGIWGGIYPAFEGCGRGDF